MKRIPCFPRFRAAAETLFGEKFAVKIERVLGSSGIDTNTENVFFSDGGLYGLVLMKGRTYVTKVILHIASIDAQDLKRKKIPTDENYLKRNAESHSLIQAFHKYHFFNCEALKKYGKSGNYKISRRLDGRFYYEVMSGRSEIYSSDKQRLYPCRYCLGLLGSGKYIEPKNFLSKDIFAEESDIPLLVDSGYELDTQNPGENVYIKEFPKIAQRIKQLQNYVCESCKRSLGDMRYRRYLHCHHINARKSDNRTSNLCCLCVKCHADQHPHLRSTKDYIDFQQIWLLLPKVKDRKST